MGGFVWSLLPSILDKGKPVVRPGRKAKDRAGTNPRGSLAAERMLDAAGSFRSGGGQYSLGQV
jgi:hypothetical protein